MLLPSPSREREFWADASPAFGVDEDPFFIAQEEVMIIRTRTKESGDDERERKVSEREEKAREMAADAARICNRFVPPPSSSYYMIITA